MYAHFLNDKHTATNTVLVQCTSLASKPDLKNWILYRITKADDYMKSTIL